MAQRPEHLLCLFGIASLLSPCPSLCQAKSAPTQTQKPPLMGPSAPQSTHYPILLLGFGNQPNWSVRIGLKGPERLDRQGYPPIPLEPAEVTHEAAPDTWTYHAKDIPTGAAVTVHLSREVCTDAANDTLTTTPPLGGRYSFKVAVDHAQIGSLKGCARIATELFPKINNQPDQEGDDTKKKPPVPVSSVSKFKLPSDLAYLNASKQLVFKRGSIARTIPGKPGYDLSLSHDGKKLLFTHDEIPDSVRTINLYDFDLNSAKELLRGDVRNPVWSIDDSRIVYLNRQAGKSQLWTFPSGDPTKAAALSADDFDGIQGWSDVHTLLVLRKNPAELDWIGEDGKVNQAVSLAEICGPDFHCGSHPTLRMHPVNPDLVIVSAPFTRPPQGAPAGNPGGETQGLFFYEFRARRRAPLLVPNLAASNPEWSRDGFLMFFTGSDPSRRTATYRIFWDGIGLQKYLSGTDLVIGQ